MPKTPPAARCAVLITAVVALLSACSSASTLQPRQSVKSVTLSASGSATTTAVTLSRPSNKLCGWSAPPSRYQHVIWIWFENHSYGKIVGSSSAPYMNNTLGTQCGLATNFHNISHPSLPNYLGATSGLTNGLDRDCAPSSCSSSSRSIFKQLEQAGLTWKGYAESMTHNCAIYDTSPYAVRHNPPPYYTDVKATCPTKDVPLGAAADGNFARDLANDTLPSFAFVAPNLCNDMHDCSVSTGDAWLKTWLTKVVNAPAYNAGNTAVFVTFDEGGGGTHGEDCASPSNNDETCHVATYVLGPAVPAGARVSTRFTHYSMLRSTESMLGLTTFLGNAATATGMRQSFHL